MTQEEKKFIKLKNAEMISRMEEFAKTFYLVNDKNLLFDKEVYEMWKDEMKRAEMQADYKAWCRDYNNKLEKEEWDGKRWYATYNLLAQTIVLEKDLFIIRQGVTYAKSDKFIYGFIDKVGKEDFIKYVLGVEVQDD